MIENVLKLCVLTPWEMVGKFLKITTLLIMRIKKIP